MEGAVERVRPKMMTVVAIMAGLLPILWGTGDRLRGDEPDCCADGGRHDFIHRVDAGGDTGDLCAGEAVAAGAGAGRLMAVLCPGMAELWFKSVLGL